MSELAIETRGLCKRYGRREAVRSLSLQVAPERVFGFLGPNGAGKSTTIRMLLGLIRPLAGEVRLFGYRVGMNGPPRAARVGALVEGPAFVDYLSARQNLQILADLSGGAPRARLDRVLELVGLSHRQNDTIRTFSHGMRQRLGIAQALIPRPRLVILDEPARGLDPQGLAEIRQLLLQLRDEEHITIFLSSHLLHEVELTCDEVGVIVAGELVAAGPVAELLRNRNGEVAVEVNDLALALRTAQELAYVREVRQESGRLVAAVNREDIPALDAALVGAGVRVYELAPVRPSLERVYMELMVRDEAPH